MGKNLDSLLKKHGSDTFIDLSSNKSNEIKRVSSGSLLLDIHTGGGWPVGRIIEVYGPESSGKTTLCLQAIAEVQKTGGVACLIDMEHSLDPVYAKALGVDLSQEKLLFSQPDSAEDALDLLQDIVISKAVSLVIVDSVAALVPRAELEGQSGDAIVGLQARLMSQAMRKLNGPALNNEVTVIFTNQIRSKIGVIYGSPETLPGGNALKFYSSIRVDMRRVAINKDKGNIAQSNNVKCKVVKNKTFPPFREPILRIVYGRGFDVTYEIIQAAIELKIIVNSRGNYTMGNTKLAYGEPKMIALVEENEEFRNELIEKIEKNV
jgi:recombination protein RecA